MVAVPAAVPAAELKLFIAEDSAAVRSRIVRSLQDLSGVRFVGMAASVSDAIRGLRDCRPDALVLDLQLEDGSGLEVLRAARVERPRLRVIVLTNFASEPYRRAALAEGAEAFLDKSVEFTRVRDILAAWQGQACPASVN